MGVGKGTLVWACVCVCMCFGKSVKMNPFYHRQSSEFHNRFGLDNGKLMLLSLTTVAGCSKPKFFFPSLGSSLILYVDGDVKFSLFIDDYMN